MSNTLVRSKQNKRVNYTSTVGNPEGRQITLYISPVQNTRQRKDSGVCLDGEDEDKEDSGQVRKMMEGAMGQVTQVEKRLALQVNANIY